MKFETIEYIKSALQRDRQITIHNYQSIQDALKERYGAEWRVSDISKPEKVMPEGAYKDCRNICALYEDFLKHNW